MASEITIESEETRKARQRFGIVGHSPRLIAAVERAVKVAPIDLSVLVTGESGTGKEFFPKIIHNWSPRKHRKYIAVNCGAIPEGTIDSELFGHEKGSFTGAISSRKGYFEEADGGTIFLDEVAELPLTTQARLLRVLESGEFLKVGSSEVQKTDIRIVAATNVDLLKAVREGKFREDLYYRLSTIQIQVPNLHDRGDDVDLLARMFAASFSEQYMTDMIRFSADARALMHAYRWPGNVRQLKNVVEQLALFHAGSEITREELAATLPGHGTDTTTPTFREERNRESFAEGEREFMWKMVMSLKGELDELKRKVDNLNPDRASIHEEQAPDGQMYTRPSGALIRYPEIPIFNESLKDSEKEAILRTLERCGSRREAARELGISERTLYRKLKEIYHPEETENHDGE